MTEHSDDRKDLRVQIVISTAELARLDKWLEGKGMWSRSAAIRRLVAAGIDRDEKAAARKPKPGPNRPDSV